MCGGSMRQVWEGHPTSEPMFSRTRESMICEMISRGQAIREFSQQGQRVSGDDRGGAIGHEVMSISRAGLGRDESGVMQYAGRSSSAAMQESWSWDWDGVGI